MFKFLLRFILIICCITLIFSSSNTLAEELPRLISHKGYNPLVITGTLDQETTSFSGNLRLTVKGGDIKNLKLLSSDLKNNDGSEKIDSSNITIPDGISLSDGQPYDIRVSVNNITHPGQYKGNLEFISLGDTNIEPLKVSLKLDIDAKPNVVPVNDNLNFQVVRCSHFISCGLATWLLPDSVTQDEWIVQLDNETLIPVTITDATVVMQGEKTGNPVNIYQASLKGVSNKKLEAQKVEPIELRINRNQLSPDLYKGALRFKVENADEPVKVNTTIAVRDAPIWAVFVIVFGILVGRLSQDMESPKAQKQVNLMPRYYELDNLAKKKTNIKNEEALDFLHQKFKTIKNKINQGEETEEVIKQQLNQLEGSISFLDNIEALENQLTGKKGKELKPKIENARISLIAGDVEEAQKLSDEIEEEIRKAQEDGSMGIGEDIIQPLLDSFRESKNKLVEAFQAIPKPKLPGGDRWNWLAKFLAALSGIQTLNAEVRYWLILPFLWLVLLIILVLLGLQTLYVNAGATFGVNGLYDYLGLFLWGLSADIANQHLSKLQSSNNKEEGETN